MRDYASLFQALLSDLALTPEQLGTPVTSDMDVSAVAKLSLANSFYKKLCPEGNSKTADHNALKKFKDINGRLPALPVGFVADNEAESCFYDYFRDNLRVALTPLPHQSQFDLDYIREHMDVGPGAAQKADSRWQISKLFESTISHGNDYLVALYRAALVETGAWADAERHRFERYGFTEVEGGKIFFAPKNSEISRTCCTEPSLNMIIQKAVGAFIEERLALSFGINLSTQPDLNGELACEGSVYGSFGTIDLVSASDSMGLQLIKRDFPDGYLKGILMASRSEYAVLPDGSKVKLNMVSTMGNGFTFPLQTLVFACAVKACYTIMDFPCSALRKEFGVFGDDIVVRREVYSFVCRMLTKLDFEVNVGKSFNSGAFRESCGQDWFNGYNVRGIYVKSLETPQEVYSCFNRLTRWASAHSVPLSRTLTLLKTWVRDIRVPPSESDDAGLKVPFKLTTPKLTSSYWFTYRAYKRKVRKIKVVVDTDEGASAPKKGEDQLYQHENPLAVTCGFLKGVYRRRDILLKTDQDSPWEHDWSVSVSIRDLVGARSRYKIATCHIPYWDFILPDERPSSSMALTHLFGPNPKMVWAEDSDIERYPLTRVSQAAWERSLVVLEIF